MTIKSRRGIGPLDLMKEVEIDGKLSYEQEHGQYHPDFLSGTTQKILHYSKNDYYKKVFKHFKLNLENSNILIVIGYGFRDKGINEIITKHFFSGTDRKMIVIDVNQIVPPEFSGVYEYFDGGVSGFNFEELNKTINSFSCGG